METSSAQPSSDTGLVARVKNILMRPGPEWDRIDTEATTIGKLYRGYVMPLAAIPVVATFLGSQIFGFSALGITYRPSFASALSTAIVQYVLTLVGVFVMALIIDALAPTFLGTRNRIQAFKVAAYSATAAWVAGVFELLPPISLLSILGVYSLYLLYLGLPKLMKAPQEKAMSYTVVTIIVAIVVWLVIGALTASMTARFAPGSMKIGSDAAVDLGSLGEASRRMQAVAESLEKGETVEAVAADRLEAFLPASLSGLERISVETASGGMGAVVGSSANARYEGGEAIASLEITDLAAMGGFAALGASFNLESNRTTETGYERVGKVDGRMVTETWDRQSRSGSYSVIVANRFVVKAESSGLDMNALKDAMSDFNYKGLEKLADG